MLVFHFDIYTVSAPSVLLSAWVREVVGGDDLNLGAQRRDAKGYVSPFLGPVGTVNSIVLCFIQRNVANSTANRSDGLKAR